ncbi:MAG TPA: PHP domain-containing protein [Candidatus Saccharimonadales bacterium]|jgi:predicted metal-dependent phosphoesterase TrpH|nr:PHP domain-containing protein [Candidatus Saccharimonadales bacterium]
MYKIDLHTHSVASPDGSLRLEHYQRALAEKRLDFIAVTDHNRIDFAVQAQAGLGSQIIVGEEITAKEGEVIGLFLHEAVPSGLPLAETIERIKSQGGIVYVPHPFETVRKGLPERIMDLNAVRIDIVEIRNGRAVFQNKGVHAETWARVHTKPGAAGSDAHGWYGWCKTYTVIDRTPTAETIAASLQAARYIVGNPGVRGLAYPKFNRLRKVFKRV